MTPIWPLFGVFAACAAAILIWAGRGTGFSPDELAWFMHSPDLDLDGALQPHAGHLILTTRIVYKVLFETVGVDYVAFRVLTLATVIVAGALVYAYCSRRIGGLAALAPTAVLLVFGSDATHMLLGNGFTVVGAVACGVAALVALDRGSHRGDVVACLFLVLGVVTYTSALAFVGGIAIGVLLRPDRWRRIWIVAIPIAIYAAWWLWSLDQTASSESQLDISGVLVFPAWAFQSLAAVLSAVTGLDYPFAAEQPDIAGTVIAFAVIGIVGWRILGGRVSPALWAAVAVALVLWLMGSVSQTELRQPDSSRYLYPGAVVVFLVLAGVAAGLPRSRRVLAGVFGIAVIGVAANLALLRDGSDLFRAVADQTRAEIGALAIAGDAANPDFQPSGSAPVTGLAFASVKADGLQPTGALQAAADAYGVPGDNLAELRAAPESARAQADADLIGALGLTLKPSDGSTQGLDCVDLVPGADLTAEPGQTAVLEAAGGTPATISARRFGSQSTEVGTVAAHDVVSFTTPADAAPDAWHLSSSVPVRACAAS